MQTKTYDYKLKKDTSILTEGQQLELFREMDLPKNPKSNFNGHSKNN